MESRRDDPSADECIAALYQSVESNKHVGSASCDLAEKIWDGCVDDATLLTLLNDPNSRVRAEVAWAVADALRPDAGIRWLFNEGLRDKDPLVRYWALRALNEWRGDISRAVWPLIKHISTNDVENLKQLAKAVLDKKFGKMNRS